MTLSQEVMPPLDALAPTFTPAYRRFVTLLLAVPLTTGRRTVAGADFCRIAQERGLG